MTTRPPELLFAVDERPPWTKLLTLGCQHAALISLSLVMVVIVMRAANASETAIVGALSVAMLALAVGAVLQASPLGSGFLAVPGFSAIYLGPSIAAAAAGGLPLVFGMTVFAGAVEIALSRALPYLRELFPPSVSGFIVLLVGIDLGLVGMRHTLAVGTLESGGAQFSAHLFAAFVTAASSIGLVVWGNGPLRLVGPLIGLVAGFTVGFALGLVPGEARHAVAAAPLLAFPGLWGGLAFDPALVPAFAAAAVAASLRSVGVVTECQKLNDADWKRPNLPEVARGVRADGLGTVLSGLFGAIGMSIAPSLVGVSRAARATSRWIAFACAAILLAAACVPKVAALFLALPLAVVGGMLVFTSSLIIVAGVGIMTSRGLDSRATFVTGVSLLLALGKLVFPDYFAALPGFLRTVTGDPLAVGVVSSVLLTLLFRIGIRRNADVRIDGESRSAADLPALVEQRGREWKAPADAVARCREAVEDVLRRWQREAGSARRTIDCRLSFDEVDLVAEFSYEGPPVALAGVPAPTGGATGDGIAHDVSAFLAGAYPDRIETRHERGRNVLRLVFNA